MKKTGKSGVGRPKKTAQTSQQIARGRLRLALAAGGEQEGGGPSSAALRVVCLFLAWRPKRAGWSGGLHPAFSFASTDRHSAARPSEKPGLIPSSGLLEFRFHYSHLPEGGETCLSAIY